MVYYKLYIQYKECIRHCRSKYLNIQSDIQYYIYIEYKVYNKPWINIINLETFVKPWILKNIYLFIK